MNFESDLNQMILSVGMCIQRIMRCMYNIAYYTHSYTYILYIRVHMDVCKCIH